MHHSALGLPVGVSQSCARINPAPGLPAKVQPLDMHTHCSVEGMIATHHAVMQEALTTNGAAQGSSSCSRGLSHANVPVHRRTGPA